jgi:predicted ATP-grasp superfamily ATP-dependent carboligase
LTGFAAIEFKRDERDGEFRFIEVNGRSVIYNTLLEQGGLNITHLTVSDSEQGGVAAVMAAQWPGAWVNLHADLLRSMQNWRREDISTLEYFKPYTRKKVFAVWSARDSGPFRALWMRSLRQLTSRFFGRSERHLKVNQKS